MADAVSVTSSIYSRPARRIYWRPKIPSSQWWFGGVILASGCCELREWDQQRSDRVGAMVLVYFIPLAVLDNRTALAGEHLPSAGVTPPKKMMTPPKMTVFAGTHGRGSIPAIDLVVHVGCGQLWHCVASSGCGRLEGGQPKCLNCYENQV
jgi:hypothetical protein